MHNPEEKKIFKQVEGIWRNITGDSATLAETFERLGIIIDDKCEFARFRDYENNRYIIYRAALGEITIAIWKLDY